MLEGLRSPLDGFRSPFGARRGLTLDAGIEVGTYTGDGLQWQSVTTDFEPTFVMVVPESAEEIWWKNRTCWHGRAQRLNAANSDNLIGDVGGDYTAPFRGSGFSVFGDLNASAVTYHYIAISEKDAGMKSVGFMGNAIDPRDLDFASKEFDLAMVKRDSPQPSIWREASSSVAATSALNGGTNTHIKSIDADGVTLDDDPSVNENNNAGRGEGIEALVWKDGESFAVRRVAGSGSGQSLNFDWDVAAAIIIDETNDANAEPHVVKTKNMSGGNAKQFDTTGIADVGVEISGKTVVLPASYDKLGDNYIVLAMREGGTARSKPNYTGTGLLNSQGQVTVSNAPALSGACTLEFWGRYDTAWANWFVPLLMMGSANAGDEATVGGTYNGGLYVAQDDPDRNDWQGGVLRVITGDYYSPQKEEGSINYQNWNTGLVIPPKEVFHVIVTHDGSGKWRLFLNGKLSKLRDVDLNTATYGNRVNGGAGAAVTDYILSGNYFGSDSIVGVRGFCLRSAAWDVALTDAEALERHANALGGAWTGPEPSAEWDFRSGSDPTGVSKSSNARYESSGIEEILPNYGFTAGGDGVSVSETDSAITFTSIDNTFYTVALYIARRGEFDFRSNLGLSGESRIICRIEGAADGDTDGFPGEGDIFDVTSSSDLDRTDRVTLGEDQFIVYRILPTAAGNSVSVKVGTASAG